MTVIVRHRKNRPGPFYVVDTECISCGAPESEAPQLMSHDERGHCFFAHQPSIPEDLDAAIRAVFASCCGAVRYGGSDERILDRLAKIGEASKCDAQRAGSISISIRNHARFSFGDFPTARPPQADLKQILEYISASFDGHSGVKSSSFQYWRDRASFLFVWGGRESRNSIRFTVQHIAGIEWLLRLSENELALVGFAMRVDKALRRSERFRNIQWFTEDQATDPNAVGELHPY